MKPKVSEMKKNEEKRENWKKNLIYTSMVAGMTSYMSLVLTFISVIGLNEVCVNCVGVAFAIIVLVLVIAPKIRFVERIKNKRLLNDILDAFGISGIFGFVIDRIIAFFPEKMRNIEEMWAYALVVFGLLVMPLAVMIIIRKKREWLYNEE